MSYIILVRAIIFWVVLVIRLRDLKNLGERNFVGNFPSLNLWKYCGIWFIYFVRQTLKRIERHRTSTYSLGKCNGKVSFQNIYIYIYIYSLLQTDCFVVSQFFGVASQVGRLKLGSKPTQLFVRFSIIPLSQQMNHVSSGIIRHFVATFVCLHFCLTGYQSAQFVRRALHYASGSRKILRQSAQPPWVSVYSKK